MRTSKLEDVDLVFREPPARGGRDALLPSNEADCLAVDKVEEVHDEVIEDQEEHEATLGVVLVQDQRGCVLHNEGTVFLSCRE